MTLTTKLPCQMSPTSPTWALPYFIWISRQPVRYVTGPALSWQLRACNPLQLQYLLVGALQVLRLLMAMVMDLLSWLKPGSRYPSSMGSGPPSWCYRSPILSVDGVQGDRKIACFKVARVTSSTPLLLCTWNQLWGILLFSRISFWCNSVKCLLKAVYVEISKSWV
jgi:hypothetical protein